VRLAESWSSKVKFTEGDEVFLKSFGIPVLTGEFPKLPITRGNAYKGIISAAKIYLSGVKNLDLSLFRLGPAVNVVNHVCGEASFSNVTERAMLGYVINYLRTRTKVVQMHFKDLLHTKEKILKDKGLLLDYKGETLNEYEVTFIKACLDHAKVDPNFDLGPVPKSKEEVLVFQENIQKRQKLIRDWKNVINEVTRVRVQACYSGLSRRDSKKVRETPIRARLDQIKDDSERNRCLNPTRLLALADIPRLPDEGLTDLKPGHEVWTLVHTAWLERGMPEAPLAMLLAEYVRYSESVRRVAE